MENYDEQLDEQLKEEAQAVFEIGRFIDGRYDLDTLLTALIFIQSDVILAIEKEFGVSAKVLIESIMLKLQDLVEGIRETKPEPYH